MKGRGVQLVALLLAAVCLLSTSAAAQRPRAARRVPAPRSRLAPLTAEQKAAIADIVEKAEALQVIYNYHPERYADAAYRLSSACLDLSEELPSGPLRNLVYEMWQANRAASLMYGAAFPSRKGVFHAFLNLQVTEGKGTDPIPDIVREYKLEGMTPYRAQRELFNYALLVSRRVQALLGGSPTARKAQPPRRADSDAAPDRAGAVADDRGSAETRVERAQELSKQLAESAGGSKAQGGAAAAGADGEWAFPKPGMQGYYSEATKGTVYDLGDGVYAGFVTLGAGQSRMAVTLVVFSAALSARVKSDFDLAFLAAYKVANIPPNETLDKIVLERENDYEHRFRTAEGKIIYVTLAHDRKTAIARFH